MKSEKEQLTFIEVFALVALICSFLSLILSWGGFIPAIGGIIFSLISIKIGTNRKYILISKIAFITSIIGLLISITALILFGLASANIISMFWGSFPYVW